MTKKDYKKNAEILGLSPLIKYRLEEIRASIETKNISYGELAELRDLKEHIEPDDVLLRKWASTPE